MYATPQRLMAVAAALASLCGSASAQAVPSNSFTVKEHQRLMQGRGVCREHVRREGALKLVGGTCWQPINRPMAWVWRVLHDPATYRHWLPGARRVKVMRKLGPNRLLLFVEHRRGPVTGSYYARVQYFPERHLARIRVDDSRPRSIEAGWGFFEVSALADDRCMLTYGAMADFGSGIVVGVLRSAAHKWMLRVPRLLKRYVESRTSPAQLRSRSATPPSMGKTP